MSDISVEEVDPPKKTEPPEPSPEMKAARTFIESRFNKLDADVQRIVVESIVNAAPWIVVWNTLCHRFPLAAFVGLIETPDKKPAPPLVAYQGQPLIVSAVVAHVAQELTIRALMPAPPAGDEQQQGPKVIQP